MRSFGKYRLIELIASGGMAEVWRAEAPGPQGFVKEVALKLIRGGHAGDGEFVRMFVQEARLASRLTHANVVQVFDFDCIDGQYYLAMELVRGRTLRQALDRCRELGLRFGVLRAVHVAAEVARALAYAHRLEDAGRPAGLVHRDVSPQNVLLSFEGEVKLADFGIARALGSAEVTTPGGLKGKLAYMAPEQARGEAVDGRADVFALGVVLWELCAGRRLFARDGDAATLAAVCGDEAVLPPSAWNEQVPPELDAVVLAALARDAARRTASAEALASELAALRLRLAEHPEDLDVGALLRRLWPDGTSRGGEDDREPTHRRPLAAQEAPTRTARAAAPAGTAHARRRRGLAVGALAVALATGGAAHALLRAPAATALSSAPAPSGSRPAPAAVHGASSAAPDPAAPTPQPPAARGARQAAAPSTAEPVTLAPLAAPAQPASQAGSRSPGDQPTPARQGASRAAATSGRGVHGEGTIAVRATPWAYVSIDGAAAGETPLDATLPAARHRLRAHHPTLGDDTAVIDLAPGERVVWRPKLSR